MRLAWLIGLLPLALLIGCGETLDSGAVIEAVPKAAPAKGDRPTRIGAVLPMFSHPFFVAQKRGLEDAAVRLGVAIDVRDGRDDDRTQIAQVETLLNLGCDGLILCPRDEEALVPAVEAANRAHVPVVTLNRRVNGGDVVCYVGADDAKGGRAQAEALLTALGGKGGSIVYLQGVQGSSPQRQRGEGFKSVIDRHLEIVIADERFADFQEDRAKSVMTSLARRYRPGEIKAIVAQSDEMALPAAEVARSEGWKKVIVIGFDGTRAAFDAIRAGRLYATVLQDAAEQGDLAVQMMVKHLKKESVPPEKLTLLPIITKENVDQYQPAY
jgi:ribose transport system substrate-binding protein